ncbi:hypothetical protein JTE90_019916 [Oedothorax gibbosus]|uniref:Uncharacterized protein n=1 Tax=Oedothorax gibbosus TaxID=931172 RepID=A0AAV6US60_9ARAC|nr:hypothetical protein JTE90_019916 [Oedothorax gibbosus]
MSAMDYDIRKNESKKSSAVLGSPFECYIVDSAPIQVKREGIEKVSVNCPAFFIIDTGGIDVGEVHCTVSESPFTVRIAGAPDATKVEVYGPVIEPGVLAIYQSRFICDPRGAGAGQLTVHIRESKAAFSVEMQPESQKERTILFKCDPTDPGD